MSRNLFIGRLPFDYSDEQLRALFTGAGTVVSAVMVPDPKNKRSRGFGFVVMGSDEETRAAIEKLNGTPVGGKEIWVSEARPKGAPPSRPKAPALSGPGSADRPVTRNDAFPRPSAGDSFWSPAQSKERGTGGPPRGRSRPSGRFAGRPDHSRPPFHSSSDRRPSGNREGHPAAFDRFRRDPQRGPSPFPRTGSGERDHGRPPFRSSSDRRPSGNREGRPAAFDRFRRDPQRGPSPSPRSGGGERDHSRPSFRPGGDRPLENRGPRNSGFKSSRPGGGSRFSPRSGRPRGPKPS